MRRQPWWIYSVCLLWIIPNALWASDAAIPSGRRTAIVQVVERAKTSVVNIHSERITYQSTPNGVYSTPIQNRSNGMGTGIIIDPRGYIVTNHHVVDDVSSLRIRLHDGSTYSAKVIVKEKDKDLALIKIDANKELPTIPLGTSSDLMVGETVIAIGNAFGYEHTVSVGVISSLNRDVALNKEVSYRSLIQTDASINPGNSGGPLLNIDGQLIGVNVAIRAGAQGISFAIPVDQMLGGVSEMLAKRRSQELPIGFNYRDWIDVRRNPIHCLTVERVMPNTPAAKAGLKPGDVIVQAGSVDVKTSLDLERALLDMPTKDRLPLKVKRGDEQVDLAFPLKSTNEPSEVSGDLAWRRLGVKLAMVSKETVRREQPHLQGGLKILEVRQGSPADKAGFQPGDVLVGLHIWESTQPDHVAFVLNHADLRNFLPLAYHLLRGGQIEKGHFSSLDD